MTITKCLCKPAGIPVTQFFSMMPSTLNYLHSAKVRMHFPAKQPCTYVAVCSAAKVTVCCTVLLADFECISLR
jgi:hypothetical protein